MNDYRSTMVADILADVASKQTVYRKYANTINSTLAAIAGVLTALAGQWAITGQFPETTAVLLLVAPFLTAVVTRLTKNGVSPSVQQEIIATARAEDSNEIIEQRIAAAESIPPTLPVYDNPSTGMTGGV